jgi:hypothetical protein
MKSHDIGVVLGYQVEPSTGRFPDIMYQCLDALAELYWLKIVPKLATAGKYANEYDFAGKDPYPWNECEVAAAYLITRHHCRPKDISQEDESQDTLQNLERLKRRIFIPKGLDHPSSMRDILFVAADHRAERVEWLGGLVLGPDFSITVDDSVPCTDKQAIAHEAFVFAVWRELLKDMTPGDDEWLATQFFDGEMYRFWRVFANEAAAVGKLAIEYSVDCPRDTAGVRDLLDRFARTGKILVADGVE